VISLATSSGCSRAKLINALAGKQIATAGEAIGTATVAPILM
jgi:hypothetical protein